MTTMKRGMLIATALLLGACHEPKLGECKFDSAQNWYESYEGDGRWLIIPLIGAHPETFEMKYQEQDGVPKITNTGKILPASAGHPTGVRDIDAAFSRQVKILSAQKLKDGMYCVKYSRPGFVDSGRPLGDGPHWAVWEPNLMDLVEKNRG